MKTISQLLNFALPIFYLVVIYLYYSIFSGRKKSLISKSTPFLIALVALHALEMATRHIALNTMPLSTAHDAFSFLAFSLVVVYLIIELSLNNRGSGLFVLSFALILEIFSSVNMTWVPETNALLKSPYFAVHASLAMTGYTALSLSAIYALMYIIQNRNLKKHRLGGLFSQMPPLTYLESMSIRSVAIGIILLGIGILHGHVQAGKLLGTFWPNDLKVILTDAIWLLYVVSYFLSRMMQWRGKWMAYLSLTGYLILILGGVSAVYLAESFHKFN
ncbi:MAG: hypothetical protein E4H13_12425 [Calditrichales bacterium]|nr:MAG: hypothetical protein E4H13_12425 [Calditrichales bacterium]